MKNDAALFVRNAWYCAGFATDVVASTLKAITILGQPLVLFRDPAGQAVALEDRCPHRFAPLSRGKLLPDGKVQCGYHGLQFNALGQCVHNPHFPGVPPQAANVRTFPVLERHGAVWVWMGDAASADPALMADFGVVDERPGWSVVTGYLHVKANYQLVTDNLLDLSHVQYLHPFLASDRAPPPELKVNFRAEQTGQTVTSVNEVSSIWMTPLYAMLWERGDAPPVCDLRANMRWDPPSMLMLDTGATGVGQPREAGPSLLQGHWLTPETEFSTHYFWAVARDRYVNDANVAKQVRDGIDSAFRNEDEPMIEAVQQRMGTSNLWDAKPVLLSGDNAPVRARRVLEKLLKAEAVTADAPASQSASA